MESITIYLSENFLFIDYNSMHAPLYSTITLFTEIGITCCVLFIFYSGYKKNIFPYKLAFFTLAYEILFNISYMASRMFARKEPTHYPPLDILLAAFHGITSLIMFIALVFFIIIAWKQYKKGINYFKEHRNLTITFLFFWLVAVVSGIIFYFVQYFT